MYKIAEAKEAKVSNLIYELRKCFDGRHICFENEKEPGPESSDNGGKKAKMIIFYHF